MADELSVLELSVSLLIRAIGQLDGRQPSTDFPKTLVIEREELMRLWKHNGVRLPQFVEERSKRRLSKSTIAAERKDFAIVKQEMLGDDDDPNVSVDLKQLVDRWNSELEEAGSDQIRLTLDELLPVAVTTLASKVESVLAIFQVPINSLQSEWEIKRLLNDHKIPFPTYDLWRKRLESELMRAIAPLKSKERVKPSNDESKSSIVRGQDMATYSLGMADNGTFFAYWNKDKKRTLEASKRSNTYVITTLVYDQLHRVKKSLESGKIELADGRPMLAIDPTQIRNAILELKRKKQLDLQNVPRTVERSIEDWQDLTEEYHTAILRFDETLGTYLIQCKLHQENDNEWETRGDADIGESDSKFSLRQTREYL